MTALLFPIQNFIVTPYKGSLQGVNVAMLTRGGGITNQNQIVSTGHQSVVINAGINWLVDYPGQGVSFNLQSQGTSASPLDKLLMVFVDNESNSQQVTIYFPDTQQFVTVPPFTTGYYPVLTNMLFCNIYNGDSGKLPVTASSVTSIIFCNFAIPGFLAEQSITINVQSSGGLIIPAVGDRNTFMNLPLNVANADIVVLPPVALPLQYVVTGITLMSVNIYLDLPVVPSGLSGLPYQVVLIDETTAIQLREWSLYAGIDMSQYQYRLLSQETGLNIPCQGLHLATNNSVALNQFATLSVSVSFALVSL